MYSKAKFKVRILLVLHTGAIDTQQLSHLFCYILFSCNLPVPLLCLQSTSVFIIVIVVSNCYSLLIVGQFNGLTYFLFHICAL